MLSVPVLAQSADRSRCDTWDVPCAREQVERDPTLVPVGKGALFVPSMTEPGREPQYVVRKDGRIVESLPVGRRCVLDPGVYEVRIGSGDIEERIVRKVLVKEGRTTTVPVTWSGLVVNVTDERSQPFRGSYELIRLPERRNLGLGLGADVELGDEVRAWILEPGSYMILKTGESLQARRDFFTFRVLPGELLRLTLVMSQEDGSLLGCGEVAMSERQTALEDWRLHLVLGADAEFNRRASVVGYPSGYGFTLGGYLDFLAQYKPDKHLVYTRLRLEEKQIKLPGLPFQKDQDELRLDALYVWRVLPWMGPYVRFGGKSTIFHGYANFDSPRQVDLVDDRGNVTGTLGTHEGKFELSKPFAPIEVKSGAGLSFIITASYVLDANIRLGFGTRNLFNRRLLTPKGTASNGAYLVQRREDAFQYGAEATAVASLRITRWVLATTEFDFLEPIQDWRHPVVTWDNNIALRLVSFVSLNYIFKLVSDIERSDSLQTEHRLLLRFSWQIL